MKKPYRRVERGRRSARQTVVDFAQELLGRPSSPENEAKILALQTIALRMNWNDLYKQLRYRFRAETEASEEVQERPERWWDK